MEANPNYGNVSPPWWGEVYIVAGGKSARGLDPGLLGRKFVLAVNDAVDSLPGAAAVFSLDSRWIARRRAFLRSFRGEKFLSVPLETFPECGGIEGATYLRWSHADGLSEDPGVICTGSNSGYGAINLAYLKRARIIHLFGYDMDPADNPEYRYWAPCFRGMTEQLRLRRVTVLNHNINSFIDAFPKVFGMGAPA